MRKRLGIILSIILAVSLYAGYKITKQNGKTLIIYTSVNTCSNPPSSSIQIRCVPCEKLAELSGKNNINLQALFDDLNDSHCSYIDNQTMNYLTASVDWSLGKAKGCTTCGSVNSLGGGQMQLQRIQSTRNMTECHDLVFMRIFGHLNG